MNLPLECLPLEQEYYRERKLLQHKTASLPVLSPFSDSLNKIIKLTMIIIWIKMIYKSVVERYFDKLFYILTKTIC